MTVLLPMADYLRNLMENAYYFQAVKSEIGVNLSKLNNYEFRRKKRRTSKTIDLITKSVN